MLIGDLLRDSAARLPDKPAVISGDAQLSYGELDRAANRVANALIAGGVGTGAAAAIISTNTLGYPQVYFGAARSGALLAHMSVRSTTGDLAYMLDKTAARIVFAGRGQLDLVRQVRGDLPELATVVVLEGPAGPDEITLADWCGEEKNTPPAISLDPAEPYGITFTGGTTGVPKAVVATHQGRVWSAHIAAESFGLSEDDVMVCTTPLFHVAGLTSWFQTGITLGCTLHLLEHWDLDDLMTAVEAGSTAAFMVPTQMVAVLNHPETPNRLGNLRYVNFGGAPMSPTVLGRLIETFPHIDWEEHYGQSEAGPIAIRPAAYNASKAASVGHTFEGQELTTLDDAGQPLPLGQVGEIATRGPHTFLEYLGDPEQTAVAKTADGWLRTGDVGYLDDEGFLFLVDRSKDMMICGGENVYPAEVEHALYQHPCVKECAVFGIPDEKWGEVPAAHVVLADGEHVAPDALIDFCADLIPRHKRPRLVHYVDSLPKTAIGKIQKNLIRDPYWEGRERVI
jgi:fatty-acyl-CoA synthase